MQSGSVCRDFGLEPPALHCCSPAQDEHALLVSRRTMGIKDRKLISDAGTLLAGLVLVHV